jgi:glyoxylase-like metal-dependent hydrolase (beta-lactamase superfamily II)
VRAVALHTDVILATSAIWQTNCVVVRSGEEAFVIDSPILPDELDALPALCEQAGFPVPSGLLATHGDWDHLLGRLAFPGLTLGCAETTASRIRLAPGEAQRELRGFDEGLAIERPRPLSLGAVQALPVPGRCGIGELELELHPVAGHTLDGMAVWMPWTRVLAVGDYLSAIEIPSLDDSRRARGGGAPETARHAPSTPDDAPLSAYVATLERLRSLAQGAAHVVPGHGPVLDSQRALATIEEDLAYLRGLRELGIDAELPPRRRSRAQRAQHARNVAVMQLDEH